jgi:hypothetical protein
MPAPVLTSIGWTDVDESTDINKGDILTFKYNVPMNTTIITSDNIDSMLPTNPSSTYGQLDPLDVSGWTEGDTWLVVTLGENETIDGGETVNPADAVISAEGLADATVAPGPSIPVATPTPTPTITPTPTPTPTPPPFQGEGIVGVSGGTVTTSDGRVGLAFPQDAFPQNTIVTVAGAACRAAPEGYTVHGSCFSIATSPSVAKLSKAATISVKYSTADWDAAGRDPNRLKLAYYSDGGWNILDTTVDTVSLTASAQTDHLSEWAVIAKGEVSAWQWWYTLLIVLVILIVMTAIVMLVVLPKKEKTDEVSEVEKTDEVPENELNGDEITVLPKSEKTDEVPENELNRPVITVIPKSERNEKVPENELNRPVITVIPKSRKTDEIPEDELNGDDVTALVNEEKNNGISYKELYVDEKGQKPTEIPREELQQEEEDEF